jgi:hypothetical protein
MNMLQVHQGLLAGNVNGLISGLRGNIPAAQAPSPSLLPRIQTQPRVSAPGLPIAVRQTSADMDAVLAVLDNASVAMDSESIGLYVALLLNDLNLAQRLSNTDDPQEVRALLAEAVTQALYCHWQGFVSSSRIAELLGGSPENFVAAHVPLESTEATEDPSQTTADLDPSNAPISVHSHAKPSVDDEDQGQIALPEVNQQASSSSLWDTLRATAELSPNALLFNGFLAVNDGATLSILPRLDSGPAEVSATLQSMQIYTSGTASITTPNHHTEITSHSGYLYEGQGLNGEINSDSNPEILNTHTTVSTPLPQTAETSATMPNVSFELDDTLGDVVEITTDLDDGVNLWTRHADQMPEEARVAWELFRDAQPNPPSSSDQAATGRGTARVIPFPTQQPLGDIWPTTEIAYILPGVQTTYDIAIVGALPQEKHQEPQGQESPYMANDAEGLFMRDADQLHYMERLLN